MDGLIQPFFLVTLTLFGLLFGSLANVVIWRVPRGESIVSPGSHCPSCGRPIAWYDNVPVLSWLLLRARCRACGEAISGRYPLVETISGVLWLAAGLRFGISVETAVCAALFYLLLVLSFIDLDTYRLPNVLVAIVAAVGAVAAVAAQVMGGSWAPLVGLTADGLLAQPVPVALAGCAIGAGLTALIAGVYGAVRGRTGLGMGDVKLLGAMGLFTGPYVLMTLGIASLIGAVVGMAASRRSGESLAMQQIPFGPFLALGCVLTVLTGPATWTWYVSLFA
jgi:leader peptidase (prepilin peptidase)/N-methyltransferase